MPPVTGLLKATAEAGELVHKTWLGIEFMVAVGLTVIVNVCGMPLHDSPPFEKVGVTVMVAVTGAVPLFFAVKEAIFPLPVAANPIVALLFVQL